MQTYKDGNIEGIDINVTQFQTFLFEESATMNLERKKRKSLGQCEQSNMQIVDYEINNNNNNCH